MSEGFSVDLKGKVAVVLGASAERGCGYAIAVALARNGAKVVVGARSIEPLQALAKRIDGLAVRCDIGNEAEVKALAQAALERYGRLDIAVNAAGQPIMGLVSTLEQPQLDAAVRVNLFGNFYFVKHMAAAIKENGSIVIVSSMSSTHPVLPHVAYASAKAATDCLVRYAAVEYGSKNIRINSVLPGMVETDMTREAIAVPGLVEAFAREVPLGRIGQPSDFANAVLFLVGPSYLTGINMHVNGGAHLARFPYPDELPGGERAYGSGKVLGDR